MSLFIFFMSFKNFLAGLYLLHYTYIFILIIYILYPYKIVYLFAVSEIIYMELL